MSLRVVTEVASKEISRDDWKAMQGSAGWLRMRRNEVVIEPGAEETWICNATEIGRHIESHVVKWLRENALDLFHLEYFGKSVFVYCLDRRDAVQVRLFWHDRRTGESK